jgi:mono/diheme cytochrome c family protein
MSFPTKLCLIMSLLFLGACGETAVATSTPTLSPQAQLGRQVFSRECGACHSTSPDTIIVGPSLAGIASQAGSRVAEQDATTYLLTSIMRPDAYLVEGYGNLMPATLGKTLTGEEIDGVVAYLLTLE